MGLVYRHAVSYVKELRWFSSTFGISTFFRRLALIVKKKYCFFCLHFLFCFTLFIVHPGLYWLWIKVLITVKPYKHHGVSEQKQLIKKGQNSALQTHCEGGLQSSVGSPHKGSLMWKTFPCYAGESVWNQGRISNTMYRNPCWNPKKRDCLFNSLFRWKKRRFILLSLYENNPPIIDGFPWYNADNAGNISTWWRHHVRKCCQNLD